MTWRRALLSSMSIALLSTACTPVVIQRLVLRLIQPFLVVALGWMLRSVLSNVIYVAICACLCGVALIYVISRIARKHFYKGARDSADITGDNTADMVPQLQSQTHIAAPIPVPVERERGSSVSMEEGEEACTDNGDSHGGNDIRSSTSSRATYAQSGIAVGYDHHDQDIGGIGTEADIGATMPMFSIAAETISEGGLEDDDDDEEDGRDNEADASIHHDGDDDDEVESIDFSMDDFCISDPEDDYDYDHESHSLSSLSLSRAPLPLKKDIDPTSGSDSGYLDEVDSDLGDFLAFGMEDSWSL